MPKTSEVAIVGGGVIGCSIAYYLAKRGIRSAVFEQRGFASGASGATAGVVGPLWHISPDSKDAFALGLRSLDAFPRLASELAEAGIDPAFRQSGILKVALSGENAQELMDNLTWQGELGLGASWVDADDALRMEPHLNPDVIGGVLSPQEGYVHGRRLVDSLVHAATRLGAIFLEGVEVVGLVAEGRRVSGVRTSAETYGADHVVIAAGPWSGLAGRWIPESLPVRPVKGQRILLRKPGFMPSLPVNDFGGYVMPQPDGSILVASTRHEGEFDDRVTADAIGELIGRAIGAFPILQNAGFLGAIAGVRPGSPDGVPIIGPVPRWEGLSVASGHDSVGVMLAPGTAQLIADYIDGGDARALKPFSPSRFERAS